MTDTTSAVVLDVKNTNKEPKKFEETPSEVDVLTKKKEKTYIKDKPTTNEETMENNKQLESPKTPKRSMNSFLSSCLSKQLTPARQAALQSKTVSKLRERLELISKDDIDKNSVNDLISIKDDAIKILSNGVNKNLRAQTAAYTKNSSDKIIRNNNHKHAGSPITDSEASDRYNSTIYESPLLLDKSKHVYASNYPIPKTPKTPHSDPKTNAETLYASPYINSSLSSTNDAAGSCISYPCYSPAPNTPQSRLKKYTSCRSKLGKRKLRHEMEVQTFNDIVINTNVIKSDLLSIPDTLIPSPIHKSFFLAKKLRKINSIPVFPQLIDVKDAPPALCYENSIAKKPISKKTWWAFPSLKLSKSKSSLSDNVLPYHDTMFIPHDNIKILPKLKKNLASKKQ